MNRLLFRSCLYLLLVTLSLGLCAQAAQAQSHGFSYQGRLSEGGSPANGSYDFQFRLLDAVSGGNPVGSTINLEDVPVAGGTFTVTLDFGAPPFSGADRWLEIGVRPGVSAGAFAPLVPNQPVNSTPYATQILPGTGTVSFSAGTTPLLIHTESCCDTGNRMIWAHSSGFPDWGIYYDDAPDKMHWRSGPGFEMFTVDFASGRIGIGNTSPSQALDVTGNVRAAGQFMSTTATGTAPLEVSSTTKVTNLNADLLDGLDSSLFARTGANTFTGNQNVTGNFTATGIVNAGSLAVPSTTRYLAIPCASFMPHTDTTGYVRCSSNGEVFGTSVGATVYFDAPVNLPHGAIITKFEVGARDGEANADLSVYMLKMFNTGGFSVVTSLTSSGSPGVTLLSSGTLSYPVDNSHEALSLRGAWTVPSTDYDLSLYFARITYTVTSPLP